MWVPPQPLPPGFITLLLQQGWGWRLPGARREGGPSRPVYLRAPKARAWGWGGCTPGAVLTAQGPPALLLQGPPQAPELGPPLWAARISIPRTGACTEMTHTLAD